MTTEEALLEKIKVLPPNLKQEAVDFVDFLQTKLRKKAPRKNLQGSLSHLDFRFTEQDLKEARNEMWRGYTEDTKDDTK